MRRIPTSHPILKKQSPTFRASGLSVPALVLLPRLCYLSRLGSLWYISSNAPLGSTSSTRCLLPPPVRGPLSEPPDPERVCPTLWPQDAPRVQGLCFLEPAPHSEFKKHNSFQSCSP